MSKRGVVGACGAALVLLGWGSAAQAAITWYGSQAAFLAAAPTASDPTGMSSVTTYEQGVALMEAAPSAWRQTAAGDQVPLILGSLTFTAPNDPTNPGYHHGFGAFAAASGIAGSLYQINNPIDEQHTIDIAGGARAFGFSVWENGGICGTPCMRSTFGIEALDSSGAVVGSYAVQPNFGTSFAGFVSDTAITRIRISEGASSIGGNCCVYDNEYFGGYLMQSAGGPVPEPATWAMMILGFGAAGALLRRRPALAQA